MKWPRNDPVPNSGENWILFWLNNEELQLNKYCTSMRRLPTLRPRTFCPRTIHPPTVHSYFLRPRTFHPWSVGFDSSLKRHNTTENVFVMSLTLMICELLGSVFPGLVNAGSKVFARWWNPAEMCVEHSVRTPRWWSLPLSLWWWALRPPRAAAFPLIQQLQHFPESPCHHVTGFSDPSPYAELTGLLGQYRWSLWYAGHPCRIPQIADPFACLGLRMFLLWCVFTLGNFFLMLKTCALQSTLSFLTASKVVGSSARVWRPQPDSQQNHGLIFCCNWDTVQGRDQGRVKFTHRFLANRFSGGHDAK
jgi:hypothetical protein